MKSKKEFLKAISHAAVAAALPLCVLGVMNSSYNTDTIQFGVEEIAIFFVYSVLAHWLIEKIYNL
jgi:type III secretory pathway component EscS